MLPPRPTPQEDASSDAAESATDDELDQPATPDDGDAVGFATDGKPDQPASPDAAGAYVSDSPRIMSRFGAPARVAPKRAALWMPEQAHLPFRRLRHDEHCSDGEDDYDADDVEDDGEPRQREVVHNRPGT